MMELSKWNEVEQFDLVYIGNEEPDAPEGLYVVQEVYRTKQELLVLPAAITFDLSRCRRIKADSVIAVYHADVVN